MTTLFQPSLQPSGTYSLDLLTGGEWTFYDQGTLTFQTVYADADLATPLINPVESDSAGIFPTIFLDDDFVYRAILSSLDGLTPYVDIPAYNLAQAEATAAAQAAASQAAASAQSAADSAAVTASTNPPVVDPNDFVLKAGDTSTGPQLVSVPGGGVSFFEADGEGSTLIKASRRSADSAGPSLVGSKGRGTIAAPSAVSQNDVLMDIQYQGYDGSSDRTGAILRTLVRAAVPSSTDFQSRHSLFICPASSVTLTEMMRYEYDSGLMMYGGNVVINQNRAIQPGSYAIAGLPSATPAGQIVFCSDAAPSGAMLKSAGGKWVRIDNAGAVLNAVDAVFTLTYLVDAPTTIISNFVTGHNVNIQNTNATTGARFRVINLATSTGSAGVRDATAAVTLKTLIPGSWGDFEYLSTTWFLSAYGTL